MKTVARSEGLPQISIESVNGSERAQFIAALAHDIRAPLQVLGLSLQGLRLRAHDPEDQELILAAESAYEEVAAITDDLFDSLRVDAGDHAPGEEGITLANLLHEVERRFRRRAAELKVNLRVLPSTIHCVANRRCVQRILDNLVSNALKHAGATRILVGARLKGHETLVLEVLDNGCGISEEEQALIFEERYRGRAAIRKNTRGQGLGLWIVRRFAVAFGGHVQVCSVVGRGTRFTVELPTYARRKPLPVARLDPKVRYLAGKLIAVLDDDAEVLRAMQISMEALGANVFASGDELQFLARVTSMEGGAPDLVVLDFSLGSSTVERTLRTLQTRFGKSLRAIVVTAYASDARLDPIRGSVPVLEKPLSSQDLTFIVETATSQDLVEPTSR
jgi:CheY-like chemotaxis protein